MSIFSGPEIANNGLVFSYDMSNTQKSWRGAPTVNLISNPTFSTGVISPWSYQDVANGNATIDTSVKYDGYNSARITRTSIGGESNMWLNLSAAQGLLPDTQYTFSAYSLAYSPNQASLFSYFSTTSNGSVIHSGSGQWERLVHTFTTRSTEPYVQIRMWHNTTLLNSPVWFTELQVEQNTFATPFANGTRTTSNNIVDLTNTNTVTANLTYASDNTFSFNGSSNHLTVPHNTTLSVTNDITIIAWVKVTNFSTYNGICSKTSGALAAPWDYYLGITSGIPQFYRGNGSVYSNITATTAPTTGVWQQIAVTMSGTTVTHYLNGNTNGSGTLTTTIADAGNPMYVGTRQDFVTRMIGQLPVVNVYNRALPAKEVLQNFEALRGRYGI